MERGGKENGGKERGEEGGEKLCSYDGSGMSFQGGVDLPESEQMLFGKDSYFTQCSVKDGASMTL